MEEADTLCSQIGIMASGALRCIGVSGSLDVDYLLINVYRLYEYYCSIDTHETESGLS
jgi:hypothetical protein